MSKEKNGEFVMSWRKDLKLSFYPFFNWLDEERGKGNRRIINLIVGTMFWILLGYLVWSYFGT